MKKYILGSLSVLLLFFSGCDFSSVMEELVSYSGLEFKSSNVWNYSEGNDVFIVDEEVSSVTINGNIGGKTLYAAEFNTAANDIGKEYVKYVNTSRSAEIVDPENLEFSSVSDDPLSFGYGHYIGYNFKPNLDDLPDSRASIVPTISASKISSYTVGSTSKAMWTAASEDSRGNTTFSKKTAVLAAYNDICNVWIVEGDRYISVDTTGRNVASKFAGAFATFYPFVRAVFGNESDSIITRYSEESMETASETGTKVNIVIYDLFNDGTNGSTVGFFSNGDYYSSSLYEYTNTGKYFYVDSYFATSSEVKTSVVSTLAHEFQHMINFSIKNKKNLDIDTNFNEMLSMLCEDMIQKLLNDKGYTVSAESGPKGRLTHFFIQYYLAGIRDYDNTALSYANAFAFGSWLCRQYGGAALVREMMRNGMANNDCIVAAVNSLTGENYSFNDLFSQFIKACYGKDSKYTFNQNAGTTFTHTDGSTSYNYPMTAIDFNSSICDLAKNYTDYEGRKRSFKEILDMSVGSGAISEDYNYAGPVVFTNARAKMYKNYGLFLQRVGGFQSGRKTFTASFTSSSGKTREGMKLLLYIK